MKAGTGPRSKRRGQLCWSRTAESDSPDGATLTVKISINAISSVTDGIVDLNKPKTRQFSHEEEYARRDRG